MRSLDLIAPHGATMSTTTAPDPRVLILTPVKGAERHLPRYVELIERLDWPREQLSVALLEGDSTDGTHAAADVAPAAPPRADAPGGTLPPRFRLQHPSGRAPLGAGVPANAARGAGARPQPPAVPRPRRRRLGALDRCRRDRLPARCAEATSRDRLRDRGAQLRQEARRQNLRQEQLGRRRHA